MPAIFSFYSLLFWVPTTSTTALKPESTLRNHHSQFLMQPSPTGQLKFLGGRMHGCQIGKCLSSKTQQRPKNSDFVWTKSKQIPVSHVYSKHEAAASSHNLITILRTVSWEMCLELVCVPFLSLLLAGTSVHYTLCLFPGHHCIFKYSWQWQVLIFGEIQELCLKQTWTVRSDHQGSRLPQSTPAFKYRQK